MTLATAAAYAPEPALPFPHCRMPFGTEPSSEVGWACPLPELWERWLEQDPLRRLEREPEAFADAKLIFLDAGDRDEHGLQFGARRLARLLKDRGRAVVHEEFPGGHRGTAYRYERSLPLLLGALERR